VRFLCRLWRLRAGSGIDRAASGVGCFLSEAATRRSDSISTISCAGVTEIIESCEFANMFDVAEQAARAVSDALKAGFRCTA
jgi:hypothetical protein